MYVTLVQVQVKPDFIEEFIQACKINHEASIQESGNLRFDVLQDDADSDKFVLYEAYATAEDAKTHKTTEHYFCWRDTVKDMLAEPRKGILYKGLYPEIGLH